MSVERPTIKDVAKLAGVSIATVSRVMNNKPDVSPGLRESVGRAVSILGYRTNEVGRSLVTRKSTVLGLIIAGVTSSLYSLVIKSVEDTARNRGYSLLMCNSGKDPKREADQIRLLQNKQVDGIIFMSASTQKMEPHISRIPHPPGNRGMISNRYSLRYVIT